MDFLWFILIGAAAGWLAGQLIRGSGFGVIGDIIIGVLGAMLGGWLFRQLGISISSNLFPRLFTALVGA
ncbi:MAG: GlsB/YeaQ/YmgE family stress response membrane protein, partial [Sedimentisphaerales bacterium]|nr:GlsB/YeaQ/YmgE family stress response membrane protein [Sedimentisphaerales bacterium]